VVHLHLRLQTAGERRAELVAFLRDATPFYTAPGGIRLRLLERRGTPNEFLEIIEYDTNEHFLVDQTRVEDDPHMRSLLARWRSILAVPATVELYDDISSEILPATDQRGLRDQ